MAVEMKDSGIQWIGEIPKHWKMHQLSTLFYEHSKKNVGLPETNLLSLSYGKIIRKNINSNGGLLPESFEGYNIIEENDIIFRLTDLQNDKRSLRTGLCKETGIITSAYLALRQRELSGSAIYFHYLFHACDLCKIFYGLGSGVRQGMNYSDIRKMQIIAPPVEEQEKIASFLDTKCGEIDELLDLESQMIDELKAYKQSIITEAVTHGLNPNVPMNQCESNWCKTFPKHWELKPVRAVVTKRNEKNNPIKSTERLSLSIDQGVTKYADKTTNLDRFKDDFTQYQLAYPDDIVLNSMNMIVGAVGKSEFMGCVSPVYYVVSVKDGHNPDYFAYLLNTPTIRQVYYSLGRGIYAIDRGEGRVNTCRLKVPYYDFSIINIPVPPVQEQDEIAERIKELCTDIDALITLRQEKIDTLKEYKKSLIFEYVTGKKQVV
jgi:type I restriction enzyme S subunit